MQIRENIEYKYSLLAKNICRNHKERRYGVLYPFLRNQERNTKISRTPPRLRAYRWDKHLRAKDYQEIEQEEKKGEKLNKKKRKEGVENLQLVEDQNLHC